MYIMKRILCGLFSCMVFSSVFPQPTNDEMPQYLFPEFTRGVILMKNGEQHHTSLNYNILIEEMHFENHGNIMAISGLELAHIDTVFIMNRKFVVLYGTFVEFLYDVGIDMYVEHKGKLKDKGRPAGYGRNSQIAAIDTYSDFRANGVTVELKVPDRYEVQPYRHYWIKKNGLISRFINLRGLKRLYKGKEDLFKAYEKKHGVDFQNQKSIIQLIQYLETS